MKALTAIGLLAVAAFSFGQRMETSIGGTSISERFPDSVRDTRTGLYLYSGGD